MDTNMEEFKTFDLGDFTLSSGEVIPNAYIAYKTYGDKANPAIIYPSWFSGMISDNEWLIGETMALNPQKYFIIVPAMIGNGQSVSPSNTREQRRRQWAKNHKDDDDNDNNNKNNNKGNGIVKFPDVTVRDNVAAQHRLVTVGLRVTRARLVLGWSMGACHTYQWLTQFPDFADLGAPFCGSARAAVHNQVFLEGVKSAVLAAKRAASGGSANGEAAAAAAAAAAASNSSGGSSGGEDEGKGRGCYVEWTDEEREAGMKALGRVYAGWGFSQQFYREKLYESKMGFKDLEDFMVNFWEKWALSKDPENMLHMLHTWQAADCSQQPPYDGDFEKAMAGIKAKTLVLPGKTDLYFPPEDSEYEVKCMRDGVGKCIPFPSIWGHWAGGPGTNPEDVKWLDDKLKAFLADGSW